MSATRSQEMWRIGRESIDLAYGTPATSLLGMPFDACELNCENDAVVMEKYVGQIDRRYIDTTMQRVSGRCSSQVWAGWNTSIGAVSANPYNIWGLCGIARSNYTDLAANFEAGSSSPYGTNPVVDPTDTYAYTFEHWDAAASEWRQYVGAKADTFRITCSGGGGAASKLMVDMDLIAMGWDPSVTSWPLGKGVLSNTRPTGWTFPTGESLQFSDAAWYVDGIEAADLEYNVLDFTIEGRNNLQQGPPNSNKQIKWLSAGTRDVTLTFTIRRQRSPNANILNYLNEVRTFRKGMAFYAKFVRDTTTVTVVLPDLVLASATPQGGVNDVQNIQVTCKGRSHIGQTDGADGGNDAIYVATVG